MEELHQVQVYIKAPGELKRVAQESLVRRNLRAELLVEMDNIKDQLALYEAVVVQP